MVDTVTDDIVIEVSPDPVVVTNDPSDDVEVQSVVDDAVIISSLLYDFSLLQANVDAEFAAQAAANAAALAATQSTIEGEMSTLQALLEGELADLEETVNAAVAGLLEAGTKMLFWQAAAPTGWTKVTTHNDKALRVVSGTGGGAGGSYAFSTVFGRYQTDSHAIDGNELTYHAHTFSDYYQTTTPQLTQLSYAGGGNYPQYIYLVAGTSDSGGYTSGTTSYAGASYGHVHGVEMRVQYLDLIIASKN